MPYCTYCGFNYSDGCPFCGGCGQPVGAKTTGRSAYLETGVLLNSRYQIDNMLGQGGFGITYLGFDTLLQVPRVIKEYFPDGAFRENGSTVIPPSSLAGSNHQAMMERFLEEARIIAGLNHPGIIKVVDFFPANNTSYYITEYLGGRSLRGILDGRGEPFRLEEIENWVIQIAAALEVIHSKNLLHQDLKPENIIIAFTGQAVLIDFGAARAYAAGVTKKYSIIYTPGYASPEQQAERGRRGPYTDIYALGATLYELLTKQIPTDAMSRYMYPESFIRPGIVNSKISKSIDEAIVCALEIEPAKRPQTVKDFMSMWSVSRRTVRDQGFAERLAVYDEKIKFVQEKLQVLGGELESLSMPEMAEKMRSLASTASGAIKIMTISSLGIGKSTLLNALLGEDIFAAGMAPTIPAVTKCIYGKEHLLIIKHADSQRPDRVYQHRDLSRIIKEYAGLSEEIREVVICYPLELLRNVELIVVPPFAFERGKRGMDRTIINMLDWVDAIIFVMDANRFYTEAERFYLEEFLLPRGLNNIFFAINMYDLIELMSEHPDEMRKKIQEYAVEKLTPFCIIDEKNKYSQRVFFVSARQAVRGREKGDQALLDKSGLLFLENALSQFLLEDRGRVIFKRIIDRVKFLQQDLIRSLNYNRSAILSTTVEELDQRFNELVSNLERLK